MVYIFGDSFSQRFTDFTEPCNVRDYVRWKGYEPKMFYDYISEDIGQPVENHSRGGMCNEYILMKFMECYHKIQPNDRVIFGWTLISRYLIPNLSDNKWITNVHHTNSYLSVESRYEIDKMRNHPLYIEKQLGIIDFINTLLPHNTIIHWTWCTEKSKDTLSITKETNGQIYDYHYGEEGHRDLYHRITNELKISNKVKLNLWV
jgi:hypothetical protein